MSEQSAISVTVDSTQNDVAKDSPAIAEISLVELLQEIEAIPKKYWVNLFGIVRLFRKSVAMETEASENFPQEIGTEAARLEQIEKNQAAIELLRFWREEGDEREQTETWAILRQALEIDEI